MTSAGKNLYLRIQRTRSRPPALPSGQCTRQPQLPPDAIEPRAVINAITPGTASVRLLVLRFTSGQSARARLAGSAQPEETQGALSLSGSRWILDPHTRTPLAEAITAIHSSVVGVPEAFVNVAFTEYEPGTFYTGGRPNDVSAINGTLRAGHDSTVRTELMTRLSASWCSITGHQSHQIFLALNEVDPSSSMEAGMILPSFGEESMWTRQHTRELDELHRRRESTR